MYTKVFNNLNEAYIELVKQLVTNPSDIQIIENNPATKFDRKLINKKSRSHLRNVHIIIKNVENFDGYKVACPIRTAAMANYLESETVMFDQGITCSKKMGKLSKIWHYIRNPDNTINANYGWMVYHMKDAGNPTYSPIMMSQYEWAFDRLSRNINTLQAIMHFNRPIHQWIDNLDQPCTVFVQYTVVDNKINLHSYMRSNDVIYGTPYNLAYFRLLLVRMQQDLNQKCGHQLELGYIHHNATSIHLYHDKINIAKQIIGE